MTNEEARFILQSYRHTGADADDPLFAQALEQVRRDPELSKWFAHETHLDAALGRKLKSVPVPPDLKSAILVAGKVTRPAAWRRRSWLALAASAALLAATLTLWLRTEPEPSGFADFRREMAVFLTTGLDGLHLESRDLKEIQTWLAHRGAHHDLILPENLQAMPSLGCRVLDWRGERVTLICFGKPGSSEMHLLVINRGAFPAAPSEDEAQLARIGIWKTASWSRGENVYMLSTTGDESELRRYL